MTDRNFYERRLGNPGYDAVVRKKIKQLEEMVGGGTSGGGSGGSGGVTSYNDLTDKPCYIETIRTEINNQTIEFVYSDGLYLTMVQCDSSIPQEGSPVSVIWDGTEFDCAVFIDTLGPIVGNGSLLIPDLENNGMPFVIMFDENMLIIGAADASPTHTFSISFETSRYHTLDNQLLNIEEISDATNSYAKVRLIIGETTEDKVATFIQNNMNKKVMDIMVLKPGGEPAMQFMVPCYEAGHSYLDNGRYNELDSVIAVQKGYVGSAPHVELVERVNFVFTGGVLSDFTAQYKHSYYIRNANDELYEITVDSSGAVVANKV